MVRILAIERLGSVETTSQLYVGQGPYFRPVITVSSSTILTATIHLLTNEPFGCLLKSIVTEFISFPRSWVWSQPMRSRLENLTGAVSVMMSFELNHFNPRVPCYIPRRRSNMLNRRNTNCARSACVPLTLTTIHQSCQARPALRVKPETSSTVLSSIKANPTASNMINVPRTRLRGSAHHHLAVSIRNLASECGLSQSCKALRTGWNFRFKALVAGKPQSHTSSSQIVASSP